MTALAGYLTNIYLTATTPIAFTDLALTDSGDHINFQAANNATQRYWDPDVVITVQTSPDGTTWTTITNYIARFCGGKITLPSALSGATPSVRVSGSYLPTSFLGNAKSIDLKIQEDIVDTTTFQNPPSPWKTKLSLLGDNDISISKWWIDTAFLGYLSHRCVLTVYPDAASTTAPNQRYECFAYLKGDSIKIAINAVTEETLDFTQSGSLNYYTN